MSGVRVFVAENIISRPTLSIYLFMHSYALQFLFGGDLDFFGVGNFPPDVPSTELTTTESQVRRPGRTLDSMVVTINDCMPACRYVPASDGE